MKATLILQEGPTAGRSYPLDPTRQTRLCVGRSSDCHIVLNDVRASRRHADIRWDDQRQTWFVVDRGSTNRTYVNGLEVHHPYALRLGDRITIGETTMVLRESGARPPSPVAAGQPANRTAQPSSQREKTAEMQHLVPAPPAVHARQPGGASRPASRPPAAKSPASKGAWEGRAVAFWFVQGLVAAAVVFLASGAFLPWVRITGTVSKELDPLIQAGVGILSSLFGTDPSRLFTREIMGIDSYGTLTLAIAAISLVFLIVDMFFHRTWVVPGIVYLLAGLFAIVAVALDLRTFLQLYNHARALNLLFDIQVDQIMKGVDYLTDIEMAILPGVWLTISGLVLLIVGGIGRLTLSLLNRKRVRQHPG